MKNLQCLLVILISNTGFASESRVSAIKKEIAEKLKPGEKYNLILKDIERFKQTKCDKVS